MVSNKVMWSSTAEPCTLLAEREALSYFDWNWIPVAIRSVGFDELAPAWLRWRVCRLRIRLL